MTIRKVDLRYFTIALVPVSIFWTHGVISDHIFVTDLAVPSDILHEGRHWLEAAGRFRFIAATWFFGALALLAVALVIRDIAGPISRATRIAAIGTLLFILFLAMTPTIEQNTSPDAPRVYHRLGAELFNSALSRGNLPGCSAPQDMWLLGRCGEAPVISLLNRVLDIINGLAGLGVGALIVGMILCLERGGRNTREEEAAQLAQNLVRMRRQLYLSSLILTFGMFFATSWMYWPLPLVVEAERDAYGTVVLASALFTGTYFCLLILSFYLPVALVLDGRINRLAQSAAQASDKGAHTDTDDWMEARGLKFSTSDHLRAGFAVTAPILAAFAGGISPIAP